MKICDAHCHYGRNSFGGSINRLKLSSNKTYKNLIKDWDKYNIESCILFSQPDPTTNFLRNEINGVLGLAFNYSGANERIYNLISLNDRIEFIPFVNSKFKDSDIENFDNIKGVKFYEPYGKIPDNLLNYMNERELNLILHISEKTEKYPKAFLKKVEDNDNINFQVAHCANGSPEIIKALDEHTNLFVDTAACSHWAYKNIPLGEIISEYPDKVLFGSDEPWTRYKNQIKQIEKFELSRNIEEKVFSKNYHSLWD